MKIQSSIPTGRKFLASLVTLLLFCFLPSTLPAWAQGTAFTYQGRLQSAGVPASGSYDLSFSLFVTNTGGSAIAGPLTNSAVGVTNGLFTTTLDFGAAFTGTSNWLQIAVSTNGANNFIPLLPRQQMTPVPYAEFAASVSGLTVKPNATSPNVILGGSGNLVTFGVYGATVGGGSGNSVGGTYAVVGGGNVNGASGIEATVAGGANNFANGNGAFVGGGGYDGSTSSGNFANGAASFVGGGLGNQATSGEAAVVGGQNNLAGSDHAFIGGGQGNSISNNSDHSFISGGENNSVYLYSDHSFLGGGHDNSIKDTAYNSFLGGGSGNSISDSGQSFLGGGSFNNISSTSYGFLGGGKSNLVYAASATVPGGSQNVAGGQFSFAAGQQAQALHQGAFVWSDSQNAPFASSANDTFNVRAQGGVKFVTGGAGMTLDGQSVVTSNALVGITTQPNATSPSLIFGYSGNYVSGGVVGATVSGGGDNPYVNGVTGNFGTVGGGDNNTSAAYSTVAGGDANSAAGQYTAIGGGHFNNAGGMLATVAGGSNNHADGIGAFVGGGGFDGSTYSGNTAGGNASVVVGGEDNLSSEDYSFLGGGQSNSITSFSDHSFLGGGIINQINTSENGFLGGGRGNALINAAQSFLGGGFSNLVTAGDATVPGGARNVAGGQYSFAAGQQAQALHLGAFVWADSQNASFASTANNQFLIRAAGGVGIGTSATSGNAFTVNTGAGLIQFTNEFYTPGITVGYSGAAPGHMRFRNGFEIWPNQAGTAGGYLDIRSTNQNPNITLTGNTGSITNSGVIYCSGTVYANGVALTSDRNAKENFAPLDAATVLAKVAALPVTQWNYKSENDGTRHIGPMAQDFQQAFHLSADDKHISVVDEGGVALAAIQGLNQKLETENQELKRRNDALEQRLSRLEQLVNAANNGVK